MGPPINVALAGYYASGGWIYDEQIPSTIRYTGIILSAVLFLINIASTIWTLCVVKNLSIAEVGMILWVAQCLILSYIVIPLTSYINNDGIVKLMMAIDLDETISLCINIPPTVNIKGDDENNVGCMLMMISEKPHLKDTKRESLYKSIYIIGIPFFCSYFINLIYVFGDDDDSYKSVTRHIMAFQFADLIPNRQMYLTIYCVEIICRMPTLIVCVLSFVLCLSILAEIYNQVVKSCWVIRNCSIQWERYLRVLSVVPVSQNTSIHNMKIIKCNLNSIAEYHQNVYQNLKLCTKIIGYFMCEAIILVFCGMTYLIPAISSPHTDSDTKLICALHYSGLFAFLYLTCKTGDYCDEIAQMMVVEVKNIPWYYFPPVIEKHYHILLGQVQYSVKMNLFTCVPNQRSIISTYFEQTLCFL